MDFRPLKIRAFRRIWFAEATNIAGDWLGEIALTVLVYDRTGSAAATAVLFLAMRFFPSLVGPALVARFEGFPAYSSLPLIYIGEAVMFGLLAWQESVFLLPVTAVLVFLNGCLDVGARALVRSSAAYVLKPAGLLQEGNSLLNLVFTSGWFIFTAIAGTVVALVGIRDALLIDAGTFLIAALLLAGIKGLPPANRDARNWRQHLRQGVTYVRGQRTVKALLLSTALVVAITDIIYPIEVILVKKTFHAGDSGYGLFIAAWGLGTAIGGVWFAARRFKRLHLLLLVTVVLLGVAFTATALAPTFLLACIAQVVGGIGNGFQVVALFTLVQGLIDDRFQARVVSLVNTAMETTPGIGYLIGGVLGVLITPREVFLVTGIATLIVAVGLAVMLKGFSWEAEKEGM